MKLKSEFITHRMGDEQVMVAAGTSQFCGIIRSNRTAAFIVDCLKTETTEEEIIAVVHAPSALTQQIEALVRGYSGENYLMGYRDDEMRKLSFSEIECITVLDRRVTVIDADGNHYRIQERLRDLEALLPSNFIRINKSTLANEQRILRFDAVFSGGVDAVFQCGYREDVSRRCFAEIRRRYEGI